MRTVLLVVAVGISGYAQDMGALKKCVAFVYGEFQVRDQQGNMRVITGPLGTAFFVHYPDTRGGPTYGFNYIVTAKHVLRDEMDGKYLPKVRVRMNTKAGDAAFADLDVTDSDGHLTWFDDKDDPNADIAVKLASPDSNVDYINIPLEMFSSPDSLKKENVTEGDQVYLVGLLPQYTGEAHNYPVVRHGYIALLSDEKLPLGRDPQGHDIKENVYALELGGWPGQSGSPIFLSLGGLRHRSMYFGESYRFLGLMLGYFANQRPFEVETAPTNSVFIGDGSNVGISFALPASEVLKVLNSKDAQDERDADIRRLTKK